MQPRVLIAGGGVAAVEAALALRSLAGNRPAVELVAPVDDFVYRALSVAEPFGYDRTQRVPLARLERSHGVTHRRDALAAVRPALREVELASGEVVRYDALVVAVGVRPEAWLQGAVTFTGPAAAPRVREVLERVASGEVDRVCFAVPDTGWTLPAYELALLTAVWCAENRIPGVELTVVTPEAQPLEVFGAAATRTVRELLADRGVKVVTRTLCGSVEAGAVIALPRLLRSPIPGLPADAAGFIPVDEHGAVEGLEHVFAAGDATTQPIKQGGLATQQADAVAAAVARALGAPIDPQPFRPVLRGMLLSGLGAAYLRRDDAGISQAAFDALWWPPTKVAGRFLGPYLAGVA